MTSPNPSPRAAVTWEQHLGALGRFLDRRPYPVKGLCILELHDGFIVNFLEGRSEYDDLAFHPTTLEVTVAELLGQPFGQARAK